jgi:hypothetical protein
MPRQFFSHSEAEDRLLCGMVKNMKTDQPGIKVPISVSDIPRHRNEYSPRCGYQEMVRVRLCQDVVMAAKRFVVQFKDGDIQTVYAVKGDQDDKEDGYVFFRDSNDEITCMFDKLVVAEWHEEH